MTRIVLHFLIISIILTFIAKIDAYRSRSITGLSQGSTSINRAISAMPCSIRRQSFSFDKYSQSHSGRTTHLCEKRSSGDNSEGKSVLKVLNDYKGLIGFYAVMLAPIYGIGLPFLGSMTDFETVKNRVSRNDYLVAPDNSYTPLATINEEAPLYEIPANKLRVEINKVVMRQPRISFIAEDKPTNRLEYVQRTLIFRFPDVITWKVIPINDKESTFEVYSSSVYGAGDLGVNADRIKGWINELNKDVEFKYGNKRS